MDNLKSFKDIDKKIKSTYYNSEDDTIDGFLVPILKRCKNYKRETYSFSSAIFSLINNALSELVKNESKISYIVGFELSDGDLKAIKEGLKDDIGLIEKNIKTEFGSIEALIDKLDKSSKDIYRYRLTILSYLISKGLLEIKIGFVSKNGRIKNPSKFKFHPKVMIFEDFNGEKIVANGSTNESLGAHSYNEESFDVFKSWNPETKEYFNRHVEKFDSFWNNDTENIKTIDISKILENDLLSGYKRGFKSKEEVTRIEEELNEIFNKANEKEETKKRELLDPQEKDEIVLRKYQSEAINNWLKTKKGLFVMATGKGKTVAAIGCISQMLQNDKPLGIVIVTPQNTITEQWLDTLKLFGFKGDEVKGCGQSELNKIANKVLDIKLKNKNYFIIGTSYNTFYNEKFINEILKFDGDLMLIADEVHNVGSPAFRTGLLKEYKYRLGLTATPKRYFDDEGTNLIYEYFYDGKFNEKEGETYSFDLKQAIETINPSTGKTFLVPYEYHLYFCELTPEEYEKYKEFSKKISRLTHILKNKRNGVNDDKDNLNTLYNLRKNILKNAQNKYEVCEYIIENNSPMKRALFFLNTNKQIKELVKRLDKKFHSIVYKTFTTDAFDRKNDKKKILNDFKEDHFDVLLSIDCFTEGVDVPSVENAVFMASSGNEKEFIQRRGRVLRRYKDKSKAIIHDIVIIPPEKEKEDRQLNIKLMSSEINRAKIFAEDSLNSEETKSKLLDRLNRYNLTPEDMSGVNYDE